MIQLTSVRSGSRLRLGWTVALQRKIDSTKFVQDFAGVCTHLFKRLMGLGQSIG